MDPSRYFLLPDGRLRLGWRFLLFVILYLVILTAAGWLLVSLRERGSLAIAVGLQAVVIVASSWVMLRFVDHQPFCSVGFPARGGRMREFGTGITTGVILVGLTILCESALGSVRFQSASFSQTNLGLRLLGGTMTLILGAASEELLFRGYPFQRLVESGHCLQRRFAGSPNDDGIAAHPEIGLGGWIAIVLSSIVFGILHLQNPSATVLS